MLSVEKIAARSSECLETSTLAGRLIVSNECLLTKLADGPININKCNELQIVFIRRK